MIDNKNDTFWGVGGKRPIDLSFLIQEPRADPQDYHELTILFTKNNYSYNYIIL